MHKTQNSSPKLVIVGVNANQDDFYNGLIAEFGKACPNLCSITKQIL